MNGLNSWGPVLSIGAQVYRYIVERRGFDQFGNRLDDGIPESDGVFEQEDDEAVPFLEDLLEALMNIPKNMTRDMEVNKDEVFDKIKKDFAKFPNASLTFKDVEFSIKTENSEGMQETKQILHPISGHFEPGSLVAIMGPSGCGKTTLLDILAQKKTTPYTGEILVNGHTIDKYYTRIANYVPQQGYGSGLDKVYETLRFVSDLKVDVQEDFMGHDVKEIQYKYIEFLLKALGLQKVRNSFIGDGHRRGISGGQYTRLNLAKGLVNCPAIAFLDEPTSGLSSTDSALCVRALKNIAKICGTTFVIVIHQPKYSVFNMFDHLILMSEGRPCYNGPISELNGYMGKFGFECPRGENIADYYLDVITPGATGSNPELVIQQYQEKIAPKISKELESLVQGKTVHELVEGGGTDRTNSRYAVSRWEQYKILQARDFRLFWRDVDEIITVLGNNLLIGILVGVVYLDTYSDQVEMGPRGMYQYAYIFIMTLVSSLTAMNQIPTVISSRLIYQNETSEGLYDIGPYMLSRFMVSLLMNAVTGNIFLIVSSYFLVGYPAQHLVYFYAITLLGYMAVESIVIALATCASSYAMANSLAGAAIGILSIFNGYTCNTISSPAGIVWLQYASPFFYAFQAIVVHIFGETGATLFGLHASWAVYGGILVLGGMVIVFKILQFFGLKYLNQIVR